MSRKRTPEAERWRRLEKRLAELKLDALLVSHGPNVRYLSGFTGSSALLLHPRSAAPVLLTDFRYEEQAEDEVGAPTRLRVARDGLIPAMGEVLESARQLVAIGFDPGHLSVLDRRRLGEVAPDVRWVEAEGVVERLRAIKDPTEVEAIRAAASVAESALRRTLEWLRDAASSPSERQIAARLEFELRSGGSDAPPFEVIVASGPRTSLPHARPEDRPPKQSDLLLIDFGASVAGYCCDITRTFVFGPAEDWQRQLHAAVLRAQSAAIEAVAPRAAAADVDRAARDVLAEHDWDRFFGHSTGHGIGLEVHEEPRLSRRSEDLLAPGHVVTVEPGVYLPGRGGVRIEDDVVVTERGGEPLTGFSRELLEL